MFFLCAVTVKYLEERKHERIQKSARRSSTSCRLYASNRDHRTGTVADSIRSSWHETGWHCSPDPIEQIQVAFENLIRNLHAANMQVKDIVKLTLYLVGDIDAGKRRQAIALKLGGHKPCMTLVYVASLAAPVYKVEVDAWASKAN